MTRRLPAFLLAVSLLLPAACGSARAALTPNTEVLFTAQEAPEAIRQAEQRLGIRITDRTGSGIGLPVLEHLQDALNLISFDLFQEAVDVLRNRYGITVELIFSSYANQGYAGLTTLVLSSQPGRASCTVELVENPSRFANSGTDTDVMVHEFTHLLHYVSEYIWNSTELRDQFYALNGELLYYEDCPEEGLSRAAYLSGMQPVLGRCFAGEYATTNYYEDAAALLQAISVDSTRWETELLRDGNEVLLGKYRALTGLFTSRLTAAGASPLLQLLPDDWAVPGWQEARALRLVPEELDCAYRRAITRGEFCRLITALLEGVWGEAPAARLVRQGRPPAAPFADTDSEDAAVLYTLGIIDGKSDRLFAPEDTITRQEAAKMLALTARVIGREDALAGPSPVFQDEALFAPWAAEFIKEVSAAGVMNGTGADLFSPHGPYTRQQSFLTALRLYRLLAASPAQGPEAA